MFYVTKTPLLLKKFYGSCIWNYNRKDPVLYLTFDDGPHPVATPWVLDTLKEHDAKATFFCIGKNVAAFPDIYKRILNEGHAVGNHTFNHVNGWKVPDEEYIKDIAAARKFIDSNLFRPPYGRISRFQLRLLTASENAKQQISFKVVMWDVLSADFDISKTGAQCASNVINGSREGSIVVFHDSEKAMPRMKGALEKTLEHFGNKGFRFETIK